VTMEELALSIPPGEFVVLERLESHDTVLISVRRPASQLAVNRMVTIAEVRIARVPVVEMAIRQCLSDMQECCLRLLQEDAE
jgi:hypothetical protein